MTQILNPQDILAWFLDKWNKRKQDSGVYTTALQMKKQGYPIEVALFVLTGRISLDI